MLKKRSTPSGGLFTPEHSHLPTILVAPTTGVVSSSLLQEERHRAKAMSATLANTVEKRIFISSGLAIGKIVYGLTMSSCERIIRKSGPIIKSNGQE